MILLNSALLYISNQIMRTGEKPEQRGVMNPQARIEHGMKARHASSLPVSRLSSQRRRA